MRKNIALLHVLFLFPFCALQAVGAPGPAIIAPPVAPASGPGIEDARNALKDLAGQLPFLKNAAADKLTGEGGTYYLRDLDALGRKITIVLYKLPGRAYDAAVLTQDIKASSLFADLGGSPLDDISLKNPVIIFSPNAAGNVASGSLPKAVSSQLPAALRGGQAVIYLGRGLNLVASVEAANSAGAAVDLLKGIGLDLNNLTVQSSIGAGAKDVTLSPGGPWKQPFGLKTTITGATVYLATEKGKKTVAAWGNASFGKTEVFLYGQRVSGAGVGDAYAVDAGKVSLGTYVDFLQAIPNNPIPVDGLKALPLDKIEITRKTPYKPHVQGENFADTLGDFLLLVATSKDVTIPKSAQSGPALVSNGTATFFGKPIANLAINADAGGLVAKGDVAFELGPVNLGMAKLSVQSKPKPAMFLGGRLSAFGLANEEIDLAVAADGFAFEKEYALAGAIKASLTAKSNKNFGLPWDVKLTLPGDAGAAIVRLGGELYGAAIGALPAELKVVEPAEVVKAVNAVLPDVAKGLVKAGKSLKDVGARLADMGHSDADVAEAFKGAGCTAKESMDALLSLKLPRADVAKLLRGKYPIKDIANALHSIPGFHNPDVIKLLHLAKFPAKETYALVKSWNYSNDRIADILKFGGYAEDEVTATLVKLGGMTESAAKDAWKGAKGFFESIF